MEEILEKVEEDKAKFNELYELCTPLIEYLHKYYNPHTSIIISEDYIRVVSDEVGIPLEGED